MNRWSALALLLIVIGALALRLPKLDTRPFHNDEAVNAIKTSDLWQHGRYVYDPHEFHGPSLHYFTLPFLWLSSAQHPGELQDATLRLAPVAFGAGLILLLPLLSGGLGRPALLWAALFTAVSPAMVFYSRYFIHEMLLVFFTFLALGAAWRYCQTRCAPWAILAGTGLGLMSATKETFVLSLAAALLAVAITAVMSPPPLRLLAYWNWKHAALASGAAGLVWLLLFSSWFANPAGLVDSVLTYLPWLKRAGGESPHIHPWTFYLERIAWFHPSKSPVWSEGIILILAGIGAVACLKKSSLHRFLASYTLLLMAVYSVISYKTPWCLLGFYHGMILLAGVGVVALMDSVRAGTWKAVIALAIFAMALQLSWLAWRGGVLYAADPRNPYVYAQTAPDLTNLVHKIEGIAQISPAQYRTAVKIIAPQSDYWPLPWSLRRFQHVGYYENIPSDPFAPVVVASSELDARLDDRSERKWIMAGIYQLRPQKFLELYVELELWTKYVSTLPRDLED